MKPTLIAAAAALALVQTTPAWAAPDPEVEIQNAVARVIVMVEDRTDIVVEVQMGSEDLPRPTLRTVGRKTIVDGGLAARRGAFGGRGMQVQNCRSGPDDAAQPGQGASVQLAARRIDVSQAPLIIIRSPRQVHVEASGAVFGAIGRGATSLELANGGCGDWTVANVAGPVELALGGSGRAMMGTSRALDATLGGSGSVMAGATDALELTIGGSGQARVAEVNGSIDVTIGGSGSVAIPRGRSERVEVVIGGSGDVSFGGVATNADVTIAGSGDVRLGQVTGNLERNVFGSGGVTVGR